MEHLIFKDDWKQVDDHYEVDIEYDCKEDDTIIIKLVDDSDYAEQHKDDFSYLQSGDAKDGHCIITASDKINCDINIEMFKSSELDGELYYVQDSEGRSKPVWLSREEINFNKKVEAVSCLLKLGELAGLTNMFETLKHENGVKELLLDVLKESDLFELTEENRSKILGEVEL